MSTINELVPNEKVMGATVNIELAKRNPLITSGLSARGPEVNAVANGGPRASSLPYINALSTDEVNHGTDVLTQEGAIGSLTASEYRVLRMDLNYGWGVTDLTRMVTQYDSEAGIGSGVAAYWAGVYQKHGTSAIKGALGATAALTIGDGTAALDSDLIIDATADGGEYMDLFDILIVSPATKAKLRKQNAGNSFVPAADARLDFDTFGGYKLIVSKAFGDTMSVVARSGALAFGEGQPAGMVPVEKERVANGGNGQGGDILHSRRSVVIHPQGFNYTGAVAPDYATLEDSANWSLAIDREMVGFRAISHT